MLGCVQWSCATCPGAHQLLLESLDQHSKHQNVSEFQQDTSECSSVLQDTWECCCVDQDIVPGFIKHECMMCSLVHHMRVRWIYGLFPRVMFFAHTSKCCWTMPFSDLSWNLCMREESGSASSCPCFKGFLWSMYSTKSHTCPILIEWD